MKYSACTSLLVAAGVLCIWAAFSAATEPKPKDLSSDDLALLADEADTELSGAEDKRGNVWRSRIYAPHSFREFGKRGNVWRAKLYRGKRSVDDNVDEEGDNEDGGMPDEVKRGVFRSRLYSGHRSGIGKRKIWRSSLYSANRG